MPSSRYVDDSVTRLYYRRKNLAATVERLDLKVTGTQSVVLEVNRMCRYCVYGHRMAKSRFNPHASGHTRLTPAVTSALAPTTAEWRRK